MTTSWLYCAIYPGAFERLDQVVRELVPPVRDLVGDHGGRWFFLRFMDSGGPHVRLRVHGAYPLLDRVYERLTSRFPAFLDTARATPGQTYARLPGSPVLDYWEGIDVRLYEPELRRYGGTAGVRVAEEHFMLSSSIVVRALETDLSPEQRSALATLAMASAVRHAVPGMDRAFWSKYFWYWTGRDEDGSEARRAAAVATAERLATAATSCALPERRRRAAEEFGEAVGATARRAAGRGIPLTPWQWVFHLVHLHNNRLGVPPEEEAVLAAVLGGAHEEEIHDRSATAR
ncbi:hypothetical protein HTZ77_35140 [Nonomuraea sp. SMC257]|uniref:Thiopeptide-type bacteriocin biosynthesis domain-containing protein n=1 Tax=Nonomuraea montanisoli TaxID=2741721 RepID=A0A7Y6IEG7_9ACTN|nr:thiopeptide-type bacteriocin biosynthesis protein [Nonomuraea montanisoli]NUW36606.1 hypothetical protein [Nonomuraea montanisoli]